MTTKRKSIPTEASSANGDTDFGPVPTLFARCFSATCPRAAECLRHLAGRHSAPNVPFVHSINPHYVAAHMADGCPQYRSSQRIRWARGFVNAMGTLPASQTQNVAFLLTAMTSRTTYYRMRKGDIALNTAWQQRISHILEDCGAPSPIVFDAYSEDYKWD